MLSNNIFLEIFCLFQNLLEYFLVPLRRVTVLVEQNGQVPVKLILDIITDDQSANWDLSSTSSLIFFARTRYFSSSYLNFVLIADFYQNIKKSLFLVRDTELFEGGLIHMQVVYDSLLGNPPLIGARMPGNFAF